MYSYTKYVEIYKNIFGNVQNQYLSMQLVWVGHFW